MRARGTPLRTVMAALLAGCALQGCAQANLLAAIDGPYVPPSERLTTAAAPLPQAAPSPVASPAAASPAPALVAAADVPRVAPARVPPEDLAYPDAQFVGPVLTAPEMDALAASPAEAEEGALAEVSPADAPTGVGADFLPPLDPEEEARVVAPLAGPARPGAADTSAYSAFYAFAIQRLISAAPRSGRQSMLLADPPSLDPALQVCGNLAPAVLVDLDPAGGLMPLAGESPANETLVAALADLRQRGVVIYWISGHGPGSASAIRRRLVQSGLDTTGLDPLIVTRFAGESKQQRRYALGEAHCLLAILGDNRSDFDELYDYVIDAAVAAPLEVHIGSGWFLAPPLLSPLPND